MWILHNVPELLNCITNALLIRVQPCHHLYLSSLSTHHVWLQYLRIFWRVSRKHPTLLSTSGKWSSRPCMQGFVSIWFISQLHIVGWYDMSSCKQCYLLSYICFCMCFILFEYTSIICFKNRLLHVMWFSFRKNTKQDKLEMCTYTMPHDIQLLLSNKFNQIPCSSHLFNEAVSSIDYI